MYSGMDPSGRGEGGTNQENMIQRDEGWESVPVEAVLERARGSELSQPRSESILRPTLGSPH